MCENETAEAGILRPPLSKSAPTASVPIRSYIGMDRPNFRLTLAILAKLEVASSMLICCFGAIATPA